MAGKSHSTLLRGWLRDSGYPICYDLPLFATVHHYLHYSRLFALFVLFATRDSSLFTIRDNSLFAIRVFQTPRSYHCFCRLSGSANNPSMFFPRTVKSLHSVWCPECWKCTSELPDFKIFWGSMPPDPPSLKGLTAHCPYSRLFFSNQLLRSNFIETPTRMGFFGG